MKHNSDVGQKVFADADAAAAASQSVEGFRGTSLKLWWQILFHFCHLSQRKKAADERTVGRCVCAVLCCLCLRSVEDRSGVEAIM